MTEDSKTTTISIEELLKTGKLKKLSINAEKGTFSASGTLNKTENTSETVSDKRQLLTE